jgi:LuxR family maltose regulon positive regulatory protein
MQSARAAVAPGVPTYLVTRPAPGRRDVARDALSARLDRAVADHQVCVLLAPAGYGKTTSLTAWAGRLGPGVGWLSLTEADHHPEHLARGLTAVLADLEPGPGEAPGAVLVVDDVHLAGEAAARTVLRPLLEQPPTGIRLVLAGRSDPGLGLSRLRAAGRLAEPGTDDLSFTAAEVGRVAEALGAPVSPARASALQEVTGGWPVAVRLALMSSAPGDLPIEPRPTGLIPHLPDYLVESVLAGLPRELAGFAVEACVCDWLTGSLADTLPGRPGGARLLEQALAVGLPLERRESPGAEPVYRWHPLMAASGRALLLRRDPLRLRDLEGRAALALAGHDPIRAAGHALAARDLDLASALVRSLWLAAVLRGDWAPVEELCGQLPAPWAEDPEILAIRSACLRNAGDAGRAAELDRRARSRAGATGAGSGTVDLTLSLARLFVLDSEVDLAAETALTRTLLADLPHLSGPLRACSLLLVGWTELRLRSPRTAIPILREAAAACQAEGLEDLAGRARSNEGFALAFGGDFRAALEHLAAAGPEREAASWRRSDGAIEWFTVGWIDFWNGNAGAAFDAFRRAADSGGGLVSYADLARCWLTHAAVDTRDPARVERSRAALDLVPDATVQGLPWHAYKGVARAGAAVLAGRPEVALGLLDEVISGDPRVPAANVIAAQLYWRCGATDRALELAGLLAGGLPGYLRGGALVIEALHARSEGDGDRAHQLVEQALAVCAPQQVLRPFLLADQELTALLAEHPAWGTRHEVLVADCLTRRASGDGRQTDPGLTGRELQVLGHLATTLSTAEIAGALHISPNTLKTHLKSVYRKLGVTGRLEAVRAARRLEPPA